MSLPNNVKWQKKSTLMANSHQKWQIVTSFMILLDYIIHNSRANDKLEIVQDRKASKLDYLYRENSIAFRLTITKVCNSIMTLFKVDLESVTIFSWFFFLPHDYSLALLIPSLNLSMHDFIIISLQISCFKRYSNPNCRSNHEPRCVNIQQVS